MLYFPLDPEVKEKLKKSVGAHRTIQSKVNKRNAFNIVQTDVQVNEKKKSSQKKILASSSGILKSISPGRNAQ